MIHMFVYGEVGFYRKHLENTLLVLVRSLLIIKAALFRMVA